MLASRDSVQRTKKEGSVLAAGGVESSVKTPHWGSFGYAFPVASKSRAHLRQSRRGTSLKRHWGGKSYRNLRRGSTIEKGEEPLYFPDGKGKPVQALRLNEEGLGLLEGPGKE